MTPIENPTNRKSHTIGISVAIATVIMATSNILSRILGFVRDQILAYFAGTSQIMDAYTFSFTLPDIINHLLAGSILPITFIPIFQRYLHQKKEHEAWSFFSNVFIIGSLFFVSLITISFLFTKEIISLAGHNINDPGHPEQMVTTLRLTRIILPAQLFMFWGALFNGIQYAKKKFFLPALTPIFYNIGIILGGVLLFKKIGIEGFSWGVLAGSFIGNVLIQIPGVLKAGIHIYPKLNFNDADFKQYMILTIPFIIGTGMTFSNEFLYRIFGSYLPTGTGSLASLGYAYKIMFIMVGIFGQAVSAGFYPFLSQLAIEKRYQEIQILLYSTLKKIGALLLPLSAILFFLSPNIIAVLLQRGAFNSHSTEMTANAFSCYIVGAFFFSGSLIISRVFYAFQDTLFPMLVSTLGALAAIPLYILLGWKMGVSGIALAASISIIAQSIILAYTWNKRHAFEGLSSFLKSMSQILLISLFGGAITFFTREIFIRLFGPGDSVFLSNLTICMISGIPALLSCTYLLHVLRIYNYNELILMVVQKIRRKK